jgi:diguanylate cyclase (GGDEF)-like protein/PAS domain S-box-containing protein
MNNLQRLKGNIVSNKKTFGSGKQDKKTLSVLQESKGKYRALFESSYDAVMFLDPHVFIDCNPRTLEMFELSNNEDLIVCSPPDLSPPLPLDGRNSLPDTNEFISRALIDNGPYGLLCVDRQLLITEWNLVMERLFGIGRDEVLGHRLIEFPLLKEHCEISHIIATMDGEKFPATQIEYVNLKTGEEMVGELFMQPLLEKFEQKSNATVIYIHDITERIKRDRSALNVIQHKNDDMFQAVVSGSIDAVVMTDDKGIIELWSPAAERLFGYLAEEAIGKNVYNLTVPERFRAHAAFEIDELLKSRHESFMCKVLEQMALRKDGTEFMCQHSVVAINQNGGQHIIASINEITDRKFMESKLRNIIDSNIDGALVVDKEGIIRFVNQAAKELLNRSEAQLLGQPFGLHEKGKLTEIELLCGNTTITVEMYMAPIEWDGNDAFLVSLHDITLRKHAQMKIMRLNHMHAMLSGINVTILRTSDRKTLFDKTCLLAVEQGSFCMAWIGLLESNGLDITLVSRAGINDGCLNSMTLTPRDQESNVCVLMAHALRENTPVVCNDIATDPKTAHLREAALQHDYQSQVIFPLHLDGKVIGLMLLYAAETNFFDTDEMNLLTEVASDISFALDHLEKTKKIDYLAYYDELTGLPNRRLLQELLNQALTASHRHERTLAVLSIGLNRFRYIKESVGHTAGDQLLKLVATRLQGCVRECDTVSYSGGTDFTVMITDLDGLDEAALAIQRVLEELAEPFMIVGNEKYITCNIGIAFHPKDGNDSDVLLNNASAAMSRAKSEGSNKVHFYSDEINSIMMDRLLLESDMRNALLREEFIVHYQPQVDIHTGKVVGAEALVRWQHPEQGLIPPSRFIPVAEELGLIVPLGEWVLRTACAQVVAWQAEGLSPVRVAVNLSALQFAQEDLVEVVAGILEETGLDSRYLELELTESLIMQDIDGCIAKLNRIRALGIELSIDDFGTGYSSLSYLKRFPINKLKIDQSFMRNITSDQNDSAITRTVINMAHDLGLTAIAEGVETDEQLAFLHWHHCDQIQGYLFSEPVAGDDFGVILREGRCLKMVFSDD